MWLGIPVARDLNGPSSKVVARAGFHYCFFSNTSMGAQVLLVRTTDLWRSNLQCTKVNTCFPNRFSSCYESYREKCIILYDNTVPFSFTRCSRNCTGRFLVSIAIVFILNFQQYFPQFLSLHPKIRDDMYYNRIILIWDEFHPNPRKLARYTKRIMSRTNLRVLGTRQRYWWNSWKDRLPTPISWIVVTVYCASFIGFLWDPYHLMPRTG